MAARRNPLLSKPTTKSVLYITDSPNGMSEAQKRLDRYGIPPGDYSFFGSFGDSVFEALNPDIPQIIVLDSVFGTDHSRFPILVDRIRAKHPRAVIVGADRFLPPENPVALNSDGKLLIARRDYPIHTIVNDFLDGLNGCAELFSRAKTRNIISPASAEGDSRQAAQLQMA